MVPSPVLVIDAGGANRPLFESALHTAGFTGVFFCSEHEALQRSPNEPPSLILLGALMKDSSVGETIQNVRRQATWSQVPVVVAPAEGDLEHEVERAFSAGADEVIRRPILPGELAVRMLRLLRRQVSRDVLNERRKRAQGLLDATQAVTSTLHVEEILRLLVQQVVSLGELPVCSMILLGESHDAGHLVVASDDAQIRHLPMHLHKHLDVRNVLQRGTAAVLTPRDGLPLFTLAFARDVRDDDGDFLTIFPVFYEKRPMAVLFLLSAHNLEVEALDVISSLAHSGAIALRNARILRSLRNKKAREQQALLAELAGATAHELNQPLTSVMGYAELLKRRLDPSSPCFTAAEVIVNEAERMAEIVRKIGSVTHYETKSYVGEAKILDLDKSSGDLTEESAPVVVSAAMMRSL